jgi:hypothetical protein
MANLIAGRRVVPELLQNEVRPDRIAAELERILNEPGPCRHDRRVAGSSFQAGRSGACRRAALCAGHHGLKIEETTEKHLTMDLYKRLLILVKPHWWRLLWPWSAWGWWPLPPRPFAFLIKPLLDEVFIAGD